MNKPKDNPNTNYYFAQNSKGKRQIHSSNAKATLKPRCYRFSLNLIKLLDELPNKRASWVIGDQLLRSGTSIGANITEATAASSKLEFKKFYEIALKSANESVYWLNLLNDSRLASQTKVSELISESEQISRMLAKSVMTMKGKTSL